MTSRPLIRNGTYRIKSQSSNNYLDCSSDGSVTAQPSNRTISQQWNITSAGDGDYELQSAAQRQTLRVNDQNQLICNPSPRRVTWTIEPRGFDAYVCVAFAQCLRVLVYHWVGKRSRIGNAADALAIQLPRTGPVTVANRNGEARQRWLIEPDTLIATPTPTPSLTVAGFPTGTYFAIRARGSNNVLLTHSFSGDDGAQIAFWPRPTDGTQLRAAAFFIDRTGALCHGSGLNVGIVDDVLVLRQRRPVVNTPNPWSHPFPRFSYENSQIRVEFNSDPALPSCSERLYPNESWRYSQFVLARNAKQGSHMHLVSDFQPWALRVPFTPLSHWSTSISVEWGVFAELMSGSTADTRTQWDIIPLTQ
ncbi:hypothetical protein BDP27DRAFT_1432645 [Rhodocollybia butyracea]|uniref:Ricin B lectin domain-containing protein n=1 Tax=Rhodocollybia butyracea TaxID=206335 RepID=A0A9P5TYL4_9AGAR|nr:hypothetical protein BDP27DRAFT_1432645 [Rhodocollybia butyracea]